MSVAEAIRPVRLSDRYESLSGRVHLTGVQALVRVVLDRQRRDAAAGLRTAAFVSGYEGSPLGGYDLELARHRGLLDAHDVVVRPGLNEESAAMAVQGTQLAQALDGHPLDRGLDGVVGWWYGKAPGLDRASDALRHAVLMGTAPRGGAVALVGDDPAAKSSSVPCASEATLAALGIPVLHPADSQDVLDLGVHAVELSRVSGLWAAMKIVTGVADGASTTDPDPRRVEVREPAGGRRHRVTGRLLQPALGPLEQGLATTRLRLAAEYGRLNRLNAATVAGPGDRLGIVAPGKTYLDVRTALAALGLDDAALTRCGVRLVRVSMPFPLHPDDVREATAGLDEVLVVEEKRAFVETAVKEALYGRPGAPAVSGKHDAGGAGDAGGAAGLVPAWGELDADTLRPLLARWLGVRGVPVRVRAPAVPSRRPLPLAAVRAPAFCSGCPHSTSTRPPDGVLVGGGIGCHAMVLLMDPERVGEVTGLTQMGGEGTQWIGMAPFLPRQPYVQNLGDGTFQHSGSLAIRALVASGETITYKLLHNSAVAMTGGQQAVGARPVAGVVEQLLAEGVARVIVTTEDVRRYRRVRLPAGVEVWDRSRLDEAQRVLAAVPGVTVLVHDQECATERRRRVKRGEVPAPASRIVVNERICEGCGDCGAKSGCLSVRPVDTEYGRKTRIHQSSCTADHTCVDGDCPSFMIVTPARPTSGSRQGPDTRVGGELGPDAVPEPEGRAEVPGAAGGHYGIRIAGIGGTGVVTVSQVLAAAATMSGLHVRSLDRTGLAQKGGAVVSDLVLSAAPAERANQLAAGECDLYLVADVLAATAPAALGAATPERTHAVVSTSEVPTGAMVADPRIAFPGPADTVGRLLAATRPGSAVVLDAGRLARDLVGDDQSAVMLLLGTAYQAGRLPVPAAAIEAAVALNGVAVARNVQAFRRGRAYVHGQAHGSAVPLPSPRDADPPAEGLDALLADRRAELVAHSSPAYADEYAGFVARVRAAEAAATGGEAVTGAVARHLFTLMAYKDEYEVARLAVRHSAQYARDAAGEGARVAWKLHPPFLRALGVRRKLTFGPRTAPALALLARLRGLRGTPLDPFGHTLVRRTERSLVAEYRRDVGRALGVLTPATADDVLELAGLPDLVRGYEEVKLANVARYRERVAEVLARLGPAPAGRPS